MSSGNKECSQPKHIVIGEGLAPPPMIMIGAGSRSRRYHKWLNAAFDKATNAPGATRSKNFMRTCCHLAIMSTGVNSTWTFKSRQGRVDETDLELTLKNFIKSKLETLKHTAAYVGVSWPKE